MMFRTTKLLQTVVARANLRTSGKLRSLTIPSDGFYRVSDLKHSEDGKQTLFSHVVKGEIIDQSVDLKNVRPGETIEVPYEVTVSHSLRDFWQSAFYSHDRINTSTPFARALGLQDQIVPFGLMLFLAVSLSHNPQS